MTPGFTPVRIALVYALLGAAWIVASDRAVEWIFAGQGGTLAVQTAKGLIYIGVTTLLVYVLARRGRSTALVEMERSRTEAALQESEHRFRSVVESAPEAIFVQTGGRFAYANPACETMLGAAGMGDLLGLPVLDRFHTDHRRAVEERIRILNEERRPVESREEVMIALDGRPIPVEISATPIEHEGEPGALVFVRDITERKRREVESERLSRAVEQAGDSIMITDRSGTIQYVNPAFERLTGFGREEAVGRNPRFLSSGEQDASFYREMWETILDGESWHGRIVNRRKDGDTYTADASISPVRDASGEIVNFVAVQRDITRELDLEHQLFQAQKMEVVGQLAGGVAHDFNNMLTVIRGSLEIVLQETGPDDPRLADLEEIRTAALRSSALVAQLLGFARKQIIQPRPLDLNRAIEAHLGLVGRLIGEDLDLHWHPDETTWPVRLDPSQVDQILTNLVINARDAIDGVGRVMIETANVVFDEEYCRNHVDFRPGEYAMLAIGDTGSGMDRETVDRIFEPFFTTKPPDQGTGLGLSTVYGIVKQNEGFINVYSEPGEGTLIRIYLPRHVGDDAAGPADGPLQKADSRGTETVLVVEDESQLLKLATRQLEGLGYAVLPASGPDEAIGLAEAHEGTIHVLVTDVVMPGMNGRTLCERLREGRPDLRCLYMSGYTADIIAERGVLEEGMHFLQKPFTLADLSVALRETLDG